MIVYLKLDLQMSNYANIPNLYKENVYKEIIYLFLVSKSISQKQKHMLKKKKHHLIRCSIVYSPSKLKREPFNVY